MFIAFPQQEGLCELACVPL